MTPEGLFTIVNPIAVVGWILLIALPRQRWVANIAAAWAIPGLLAITYVAVVATHIVGSPGGFSSLPAVATLFANPWLLLAGWIHYLAFDLFVGSWEARDARERGVPHLALVPCLLLTFLFGPAGWLLYLLARRVLGNGARG
jgi:ABA DEFICIENT 4-like